MKKVKNMSFDSFQDSNNVCAFEVEESQAMKVIFVHT